MTEVIRGNTLIWPDVFPEGVKAFFTTKLIGADLDKISAAVSIRKEDIYLPLQKHTDIVFHLNHDRTPVIADAVVTPEPGILIGVQVADCIPVLLFDRGRFVIGVVHAGWKGTSRRILMKTVLFLQERFRSNPENILVAFGPSIRGSCYPVGAEVKDEIVRATGAGDYIVTVEEKYYLDLVSANTIQARCAGIPAENIWTSPECTCCNPDVFHSYRHHGNFAGRQAGFIGIFQPEKCI